MPSFARELTVIFFLGIVIAVAAMSFFLFRPTSQADVKGMATTSADFTRKHVPPVLSCGQCVAAGQKSLCFYPKGKVSFCADPSTKTATNTGVVCVTCGNATPTTFPSPRISPRVEE